MKTRLNMIVKNEGISLYRITIFRVKNVKNNDKKIARTESEKNLPTSCSQHNFFFCYKVLNVTFGRDSMSSLDPPSYHCAACCSKGKRTKIIVAFHGLEITWF